MTQYNRTQLRKLIVDRKLKRAHDMVPPQLQTEAIAQKFGLSYDVVVDLLAAPLNELDALLASIEGGKYREES